MSSQLAVQSSLARRPKHQPPCGRPDDARVPSGLRTEALVIRGFTAAADIAAAQTALRGEFYAGATILNHGIGFPGGGTTADIAWHPSIGIWGHIDTVESARGPDGSGGRYWNAFGVEDPSTTSSLSITVEANPPLEGTKPRVGGVFGRDGDGPTILLHRGNIGGGAVGVGKELFWREFVGHTAFVYDGAGLVDCAIVATLGQETLVTDLKRFVDAVSRIKTAAR